MIVRKTLDVILQCENAGCSQHTGLTHAATDDFAPAPCLCNEFPGPAQDRADRRAEPFRKTDRHRVEMAADLGHRNLKVHSGIEHARAVQMQSESACAREFM